MKITPEVQQIFTWTTKMEDNARSSATAYKEARESVAKLKALPQSAANDALIKKLEDIAPVEAAPTATAEVAAAVEEAQRNHPLRQISRISGLN